MDDRQLKLRVGLVTIAAMFVFFVLIGLNTPLSFSLGGKQATIKIQVASAPGVGRNTPVRRDGVLIGRVESTEPVRGGVIITAKVNPKNPPLVSDRAQIRPSSLFGDAVIDFEQDPEGDQSATPPNLVIQATATPDPLAALQDLQVNVAPAIQSLGRAGDQVSQLADRLNAVLGDDVDQQRISNMFANLDRAVSTFDTTMAQMSKTMASVDAVIGQEATQEQLRKAIGDFPELVANLREAASTANQAFSSLDGAVVSAEANLKNIEELTKPLGEKGAELVQLLSSSLENLDLVLADAQRFTRSLNNGQGSLGKFVNDREFYDNLSTTVCNANQTIIRINDLAKQLRPILGDVRVISDKVAREPGRVIGGALMPGPGLK
jgi:phospholipid/cholesterol/gamma-HCH transport system substrate-binding protein